MFNRSDRQVQKKALRGLFFCYELAIFSLRHGFMIREWLFVVLAKMNWLDIHQIPVQNAALDGMSLMRQVRIFVHWRKRFTMLARSRTG